MNSPIGVFDSGVGGLSVARQILRILPRERIIYFADTAHVPYGERPLEEIRGFALDITRFLIEQGVKAVVMACNMSSAVALDVARVLYPDVPIIGVIEPGARAAVRVARGKPVGVLATTGTVRSGAYVRAISAIDSTVPVVQQACPRFVPLVEAGLAESEEAETAARDYVEPLIRAGCGTIVLGCTHYPFLRKAVESAAGPGITIVDPAEETATMLAHILSERGILAQAAFGPHEFYVSGDAAGLRDLGSRFLGIPIRDVKRINLSAGDTESVGCRGTNSQVGS
ncbi:MAG: glutamate racemase [Armatimonadota bacterium]|nr:glutamate racemase [Armatimonadota bacterium]